MHRFVLTRRKDGLALFRRVRYVGPMSITIELPPDMEKRVAGLPDLGQRVTDFLRDELEYEEWRKERYSDEARAIVREGLADAERDRAAGMTREEGFRRFFEVYDRITTQLAEKQ